MTVSNENSSANAASPDYAELRNYLLATVMQGLSGNDLVPEKRQQIVEARLSEALLQMKLTLSDSNRKYLLRYILDEISGYGPLQPLLDDPDITEIMVNGSKKVYIERKGRLERTKVVFEDNDHVLKINRPDCFAFGSPHRFR